MNTETEWLTDARGNKCSVAYFGSREAAQAALDSLKNCDDCINCSDCSYCSRCSRCSDCSGCSDCSYCKNLIGQRDIKGREGAEGPPPVPTIPDIHKAVYAAVSQPSALDMSSVHVCETTHCRAGWAIHLAGEAGYALEKKYNAEQAGRMIYLASTGRVPHFYATNARALEDIRECAAQQNLLSKAGGE